jgi:predicted dehydrogenase
MGDVQMVSGRVKRRELLQAAVIGMPFFVRPSALGLAGLAPPSERITLGLIGCGGHGRGWNLDQVFRHPDAQVIAVCDVDANHLAEAKRKVDAFYQSKLGSDYGECAAYKDFRRLINRKDIIAVMNCTPDHWHVIPAIMAAKAGKDVLCEKPLTLFVEEGQVLCQTVEKHRTIFQVASENRSIDAYIRLVSLVRKGVLGQLKHIEVRLPMGNTAARLAADAAKLFGLMQPTDPPPHLDYEMWLGQAPWMPYVAARVHGNFRWHLAFSGGVLTDWGAHMIDLAQWGHNSELSGPVEVEGKGDFPPRDALYNTAPTFDIHYRYADGVTMRVSAGPGDLPPDGQYDFPVVGRTSQPGIRFEGTDGWLESYRWRGGLRASRRELLEISVDPQEVGLYVPTEVVPREAGHLGGEHRNFLDCIKSRKPCYAPAIVGHKTLNIAHIGNIAMMLGRKLRWDPDAERFPDDEEANRMLTREQREPWTMKNIDNWLE